VRLNKRHKITESHNSVGWGEATRTPTPIYGLTKNKTDIQPDILHGDTQAQSAPVYGLTFLLGIKLMPRIRNWKDLKWFRPMSQEAYKNIDELFNKEAIDWDLIACHLLDMLQVAQF
jgi:TnpA family transposase